MRPHDTTPEAHEHQLAVYRRMSVAQKLEAACELCDVGREQMVRGILADDPNLSREEAWREMLRRVLGDALFRAAFARDAPRPR